MARTIPPKSKDVSDVPARTRRRQTRTETRLFLLTRSKRTYAPVPKYFIQNPNRKLGDRSGPLAEFVSNGDLRGLRALLFLHAIISSGEGDNGWSTTLPLAVWARVLRHHEDRVRPFLLDLCHQDLDPPRRTPADRPDPHRPRAKHHRDPAAPRWTGDPYTRPDGNVDKFIKLTNKFWTEGWHEKLDMAATAMLLVALHEKPGFELPTEHVPTWYGWSADTAERGLKTLREAGLLEVQKRIKKAPLSPTGATEVNIYTLVGPFAQEPTATTKTKPPKRRTRHLTKKATVTMGRSGESKLSRKYAHIPEVPAKSSTPAAKKSNGSSTKSRLK